MSYFSYYTSYYLVNNPLLIKQQQLSSVHFYVIFYL